MVSTKNCEFTLLEFGDSRITAVIVLCSEEESERNMPLAEKESERTPCCVLLLADGCWLPE
jgi:hypothetical protein